MKRMFRELNSLLEFAIFDFPDKTICCLKVIWFFFYFCAII